MKFWQKFAVLLVVFIAAHGYTREKIVTEEFAKWQKKYNMFFEFGTDEYKSAYDMFEKNYMKVIQQDLRYFMGQSNFRIKLNARATEANKSSWNGVKVNNILPPAFQGRTFLKNQLPTPPPSLDYRKLGLVTDVKDQGFTCSCCYAFAATCGIEGQWAKKYGKLVSLSPQNIVDCSKSFGNLGCDGGYMSNSYDYIINSNGISSEAAYPFTGRNQTCRFRRVMRAANVTSYNFVNGDEEYIKRVLATVGPLPAGVRGSLDSFYYYSSGIYDDPNCGTNVDHAVCIVGYGTDNSTSPPTDYWIIKNSWSKDWGEDGYFRLKMGTNACGIRNYIVYPVV